MMNSKNKTDEKVADDNDDECQYIFPQRLMSVLSDESNHEAICWLPHGRAFIIRNRTLFAEKVMPKFFPRKSKYSSFTRKLNRWNFIRVSSGPELGAYYHEFFLRDQPHLAAQMFCKNARTKIAMASSEPDPAALQKMYISKAQEQSHLPSANAQTPDPVIGKLDPTHILMTDKVDSAMQMILEQQLSVVNRGQQQMQRQQLHQQQLNLQQQNLQRQQLNLQQQKFQQQQLNLQQQKLQQQQLNLQQQKLQQQINLQQQQLQQQNPMLGDSALNLLLGNTNTSLAAGSTPTPGTWLQQEILAQKQQQQRMMQLQQMMTLNLRQQNRKPSAKKNFRASAA